MNNNDYTLEQLESLIDCPECGDALDTGMGFGRRDYECESCDFSASFPIDDYFALLADHPANCRCHRYD